MKEERELCETFAIRVRQDFVPLSWLFNISTEGCMNEMKAKVGNIGTRLKIKGMGWTMLACLFADDTMLSAESKGELKSNE